MASGDVIVRIVEAIAERGNVDPADIPPLERSINTDALDTIVQSWVDRPDNDAGEVRFFHAGFQVTVDSTGNVHVVPDQTDVTDSDSTSKTPTDD